MYDAKVGLFAPQTTLEHCYLSYVSPSHCAVLPTHLYLSSLLAAFSYTTVFFPFPCLLFRELARFDTVSPFDLLYNYVWVWGSQNCVSLLRTVRRVGGRYSWCCSDLGVCWVTTFLVTLSKPFLYYACGAFLFSVYTIFIYTVAK
jgi:hypothetical protein